MERKELKSQYPIDRVKLSHYNDLDSQARRSQYPIERVKLNSKDQKEVGLYESQYPIERVKPVKIYNTMLNENL